MAIIQSKTTLQNILNKADIKINGSKPWDIKVHNESVYDKIFKEGTLGVGESYMAGWWDAKELDQFFYRIFKANLQKKISLSMKDKLVIIKANLFNLQTKIGSLKVAYKHYNLNNNLFTAFLDPYNQYTCGYFKNTDDLNKAQEQKLSLICKKLYLSSKDKVLDIGCGWGGFAKYAAKHFGCHVTGITISESQAKYARNFTKGLPVNILVKDYRDLKGNFDKILICGMIEHVGHKNYGKLMEIVHSVLDTNGIFLLHTIGANDSKGTVDPWINKYIFPNSQLPTLETISHSIDGLFVMEDWHNFGAYYYLTLMAWFKNFDKTWVQFKNQYDEKFYRMFKYYFLICAGLFKARKNQLWQIVLSKNGVLGGYETFR